MNHNVRFSAIILITLFAVPVIQAGEDFLSNWGYNDPLIDQHGHHALCLESKSYHVNVSDPRFQKCPKNTCRFDSWRAANYFAPKYSKNPKYALRRIAHQDSKKYLYIPTTNVESVLKPELGPDDVEHPRKVVVSILNADFGNQLYQTAYGQMVAEQHNAAFYAHFLDAHYRTGKESTLEPQEHELEGNAAIRRYLDPIFLWELLPKTHPDKKICASGNVTFTKRVYDIKHPDHTKEQFNTDIMDFIHPEQNKHNCLVIIGFFKNLYPCPITIKNMWDSIESEIEQAKSVKSYRRDSSAEKIMKRNRNTYTRFKYMATHQDEFISNHRPVPILLKRPKRKYVKKTSTFDTSPQVGHIIGDTSYNRDNNADLLLTRLRHKNLQKKNGQKGGLFLDGKEI
mmetsp:Transcript_641/g.1476  ORF Transcript_641/g.1476 Transcript_641/m.1476 type:complete len:398 (-) Transcript_641:1299-2492(-)